jgi:glyoxylase-like metal-dependent hydrolase (beta-lactamase superfamily II)
VTTIRVGATEIDRVDEQTLAIPLTLLTDDDEFIERRIEPLPSGFLDRDTMTFQFSNHSWLLRVDDRTVLVDPCNGNGRTRSVPNFDQLDGPYLERLAACGTSTDDVDIVFCTHLHNDHCGWNTQLVDGRWVPTFPNAEYLFVDTEYRRWDTAGPVRHPNEFNESVFDECVRPVVDAGQARLVAAPHSVSSSLTVELAPGHTTGHSMLRLETDGSRAYFTGDCFHHPAQVTRPEFHLPGCDDLALAIETRWALVARIHEEGAFMFPAHFSDPHYGSIDIDGDEYVFIPGGATAMADATG